ncbi:MAG: hypothetical protein ACI9NC_000082, partial [Verrucomicrobiales bacterium]
GVGQTTTINLPPGTMAKSLRVGFENGATNPNANTSLIHFSEVRVFAEIDLLPVIDAFTATPTNLSAGGTAQLAWSTSSADSVSMTGLGSVASDGNAAVTPSQSTIYHLTASNSSGSRTSSLAVIVDDQLLSPRITEFMASNGGTITRSDGSTPDWIEIWNPNPVALNLAGYRLTDDSEQPLRFVFPEVEFAAGGYLVIDAAPTSVDGVLATGFALSRAADSMVSFSTPSGESLQNLNYPRQRSDVSFGLDIHGDTKFFRLPTPGAPNAISAVDGFVADTQFSVRRGFYETPQSVSITTSTPDATIYYTTDGSEPSADNPGAQSYLDPIAVDSTTVLRAAAFLDGYQPTDIDTQTYLFADDVGNQSSTPTGFPATWVPNLNGSQAGVPAFSHYGMDATIMSSLPLSDADGQSFDLTAALKAIPTMSLAIDAVQLLDPVNGLHVNAQNRGRAWERPASIEFIDPASGDEIQANCGLRMHGGWNRFNEMLKKSFRLYFRSEYGDSKLDFPLFPESEIQEFDALILRSGNGKAWASPWRNLANTRNSLERTTYLRDQFVRDLQAATGNHHIPGRFVHLYVNGHYWGLYNPVERPDESFASARFGGGDDDYDVIKWRRGIGHQVSAGNDETWNQLIALVRGTPSAPATYSAVAERLDLPSFVDYMLVNYFAGNSDWIDNNVYAMRNRVADGPFRFFCWDSEESFLGTDEDFTNRLVTDTCTEIHHALRNNPEYRILFADRAQRHLFNGGALTPEVTEQLWSDHAANLDRAIVAESARWGGLRRPGNPYDRTDWLGEINNLRDNYLGQRVSTTLGQLRADSLFPAVDAPTFSPQRGGQVATGTAVTLESGGGQIYYTLDGSDPRQSGGAISPTAIALDSGTRSATLVDLNETWSFLDDGSDLGTSAIVSGDPSYDVNNWKHPGFDHSSWETGDAPLGYGEFGSITIQKQVGYGGVASMKHTTTYFRKKITTIDTASIVALQLRLRRDDGAVVYLNGHEIVRSTFPVGTGIIGSDTFAIGAAGSSESDLLDFDIPASLLEEGENTLAVEVHQSSGNSSDLGFDMQLLASIAAEGGTIPIDGDTLVRARVFENGAWSALDEALFVTGDRSTDLYASEVMYHPGAPFTGDAEFLEIANRGSVTHSLVDLRITGGIQFTFAEATATDLAPGGRLVIARDLVAFASSYPAANAAGQYNGGLGNGGDTFALETSGGDILWTLTYSDAAPWPGGTDGDGRSLIYVGGEPNDPSAWRPSASAGGNPDSTDSLPYSEGTDLVDYAMLKQNAIAMDEFQVTTLLGADDVELTPYWSADLTNWSAEGLLLVAQQPADDSTATKTWRLDKAHQGTRTFFRMKVEQRVE